MREWSEFYNAVCSGRLSRLALIWLSSARLDAPAPELGSAQQAARAGSRQLGSGWLRLLELPQHYRHLSRIVVRQVGDKVTTGLERSPHLLHKWAWMQNSGHETGDISQS